MSSSATSGASSSSSFQLILPQTAPATKNAPAQGAAAQSQAMAPTMGNSATAPTDSLGTAKAPAATNDMTDQNLLVAKKKKKTATTTKSLTPTADQTSAQPPSTIPGQDGSNAAAPTKAQPSPDGTTIGSSTDDAILKKKKKAALTDKAATTTIVSPPSSSASKPAATGATSATGATNSASAPAIPVPEQTSAIPNTGTAAQKVPTKSKIRTAATDPSVAGSTCKTRSFLVNDYGKDGPTKDAKDLLDKDIADWTKANNIKDFKVGPKSVSCYQFLNFGVFDEWTCTAQAKVCWQGPPTSLPESASQ
jgi:hypothetical protein